MRGRALSAKRRRALRRSAAGSRACWCAKLSFDADMAESTIWSRRAEMRRDHLTYLSALRASLLEDSAA
ncbi:MAG: hypothetical protein ACLTSX_06700 [Collinsella sp.]